MALDVALEATGNRWQGRIVDLSPYTVKVRSLTKAVNLPPGTNVDLRFALPEQGLPLSLTACVLQANPESIVLNLKPHQFQSLKDLVDSLLEREWQQVLNELHGLAPSAVTEVKRDEPSAPRPEPTREVERVTAQQQPAPLREVERVTAQQQPAPLPEGESEKDPLPELLAQAGLDSLRLPSNGALSPQWRDFLHRLGSGPGKTVKPTSKKVAKR